MNNNSAGSMAGERDEQSRLVPKLRFPEFQDATGWELWPLKKLAKRRTRKNVGCQVGRVLTNSAELGVVDQRDYFEKDIADPGNLQGYVIVEKGDYVYNPRVSILAPVGPIHKNDVGLGVMSPLYTVFSFDSAKNDFYAHYFKTPHWHGYLRQVSNSGARHDRMAISADDFINLPVPVSHPLEQQKIADCLSSIDALIATEADRLEALKDHKQALTRQLFPAPGESTPRLRFPEFQDAGEWNTRPLESLCRVLNNRRKPIARTLRVSGPYPYYGASGVVDYVNDYIFNEPLILVGEDGAKWGSFERTAFIADGRFWVNNHAHVLRPEGAIINFLENYLVMLDFQPFVTGKAPPKLTLGKLRAIPIPTPPTSAEQLKIGDALSSMNALMDAQVSRIEELTKHKKGLMQQLFPVADEVSA